MHGFLQKQWNKIARNKTRDSEWDRGGICRFKDLTSGTKQECPISHHSFSMKLETLANTMRQKKEIRGIKIGLKTQNWPSK